MAVMVDACGFSAFDPCKREMKIEEFPFFIFLLVEASTDTSFKKEAFISRFSYEIFMGFSAMLDLLPPAQALLS